MGFNSYVKYGDAVSKLQHSIASDMVSHAYILEGDFNVDKMGFALSFLQALLCKNKPGEGCGHCPSCKKLADGNYEDLYLVKPEEQSKKTGTGSVKDGQIEELQTNLKGKPAGEGGRNLAIIASADSMTMRAQTRLLKTLEEPAEGTVILILSENVEKLLPTIRSRCITLRLMNLEGTPESELAGFADEILTMILERGFFFDIKKKIDKKIKGRNDAYAFLDGMESVLGRYLRGGGLIPANTASRAISYVEEARRNIQRNMIVKYAIMSLIIRLEELS